MINRIKVKLIILITLMEYLLDINTIDENSLHDIKLHSPIPIQGGSYLAKITLHDNPILFQMPKCSTKRGMVTSGKRWYCDLLFNYDNSNVMEFIESIETIVRDKILDKNELWFQDPPSLEDIEYNWNESIKQTKQNFYLRTFIGKKKNTKLNTVTVYNSDQEKINIDSISPTSNIITIVEVTGLKFSGSSFHINYCLRQIMVLEEKKPIFNKCLINFTKSKSQNNDSEEEEDNNEETDNEKETADNEKETADNEKETADNGKETADNGKETADNGENELLGDRDIDHTKTTQSFTEDDLVMPEFSNNAEHLEKIEPFSLDESSKSENKGETQKTAGSEQQAPSIPFEKTNISTVLSVHDENEDGNTHDEDKDLEILAPSSKEPKGLEDFNIKETVASVPSDTKHLEIREIELAIPEEEELFQLKKPDAVYLDMYKQALQKAKEAKIKAIQAYLELKDIKNRYMIQEVDEDDDDTFSELTQFGV